MRQLCLFVVFSCGLRASDADALAIVRNIQARHIPFGTIVNPVYANAGSDQIVNYTRCGDSAIWTGHYLAAEAFRYKVTRAPDALANAQSAVAAIKLLVDVTGTDLLSRCAVPFDFPYAQNIISEEAHNGIVPNGTLNRYWVGNTSRDQYTGAFFGLAVAYDMVDDAALRTSISALVTRMLDFLVNHAWTVVMPDGTPSTTFLQRPDQQLTLLQIGRHVNSSRFGTSYDVNKILLGASVAIPIAVEVQTDSSYFKFNLDYLNLYNLIRLESSSLKNASYIPAYVLLRNHTQSHGNAIFNTIDAALNGPNAARDAETVAILEAWLTRPRRDVFVDLRGKIPACSADEACAAVPVAQRVPSDYLWQQDPFRLDGGGAGTIETAGIDYILPYWMARSMSIESSSAVVLSASGAAAVAPEAVASFYGTGLATTIAPADSPSLSTTLGGVSVQVTDSAGTSRLAGLYYVSPTLINFVVPAGTVPGRDQFTVLEANHASVTSALANVQNVSPGLYTADGSGKGPASAVALKIGAGGITSNFLTFQCGQGTCTTVPIQLGVDTPIFVSLYGTGIRHHSASPTSVSVTIGGVTVTPQFAGAQGTYPGLDQVNVPVPLSLRGAGEVDVVLTVDGQVANTVRLNVQ